MSQVIGTNVSSLNAQRNLNTSQASLQTSLQRLSSGMRINSAKDDAAGLAISQRFTAQINGSDQATRNANDGISLAQTAEGALSATTDNLQRIRQLAVQSANATNSASDRAALQTEVGQLKSEIDRVGNSSSFNGVSLLASNSSFVFQVGANTTSNDTISVNLTAATLSGLGSVSTATTQSTSTISSLTTGAIADSATDFVKINGTSIGAIAATGTSSQRAAQIVDAINQVSTTTGVNATVDTTSNKIVLSSTGNIAVTIGSGSTATDSGFAGTETATAATQTGLTSLNISSYAGAQLAIQQVDSALAQISSQRATLGAVQNRFSSVVSNLQTTSENLSSSRSRIQDTDFAAETANLTKAQILQQAGTAMLAQANSLPNNVLSLLKG